MFFQEGSRDLANLTALLAKERAKKMTAISGLKCLEQYERLPRATSWGKMLVGLLVGMEVWYSTRCKLTWKMKATKYNRLYFQLVPSTHHTEEIEFGLLPTPKAREAADTPSERNRNQPSMESLAVMGLLPTPTTMDYMAPKTDKAIEKEMTITRPGRTQLSNLRDVVIRQPEKLLPTPSAADGFKTTSNTHQENLNMLAPVGSGFQLNPQFVGEMMGFPTDWTELPFLNGEVNQ